MEVQKAHHNLLVKVRQEKRTGSTLYKLQAMEVTKVDQIHAIFGNALECYKIHSLQVDAHFGDKCTYTHTVQNSADATRDI